VATWQGDQPDEGAEAAADAELPGVRADRLPGVGEPNTHLKQISSL